MEHSRCSINCSCCGITVTDGRCPWGIAESVGLRVTPLRGPSWLGPFLAALLGELLTPLRAPGSVHPSQAVVREIQLNDLCGVCSSGPGAV